ncbi:MAG: hypothetical protein AAGA54_00040 [Myxococcota bacterium]
MKLFDALGRHLEEAWTFADRDEERFPDIAAAALEGFAARFDAEAFYDAQLDAAAPGRQHLAPLGAFGQPGFTAFHGQGFVVEVYVWTNAVAAIHNHPFCGAFTILQGDSVHARYQTSSPRRAGARGQLLDVRLTALERVTQGHVQRFSLRRHPLIHALIHVPIPTISMVVRTTRTEGYYRYLPPSLALPMEPLPEPAARRIALLETLLSADVPSAIDRACRLLRGADFETTVRLLCAVWPGADPTTRAVLWGAAADLHGDRREAIEAALRRAARLEEATAIRHVLRDPQHRLCATALAYAESRTHVETLLATEGDPDGLLNRFIDEAGVFAADEAASALIARCLVDGDDDAAILAALTSAYGADEIVSQRDAIVTYANTSIFSVLRR